MSVVQLSGNYQICATCSFWNGQRREVDGEFVFNNRDTGLCGGSSFCGWNMGAISTCREWQLAGGSRPGPESAPLRQNIDSISAS